jgi:glycolate oxidase
VEGDLEQAATNGEIIDAARAVLSQELWDFIEGAAETETTAARNRAGLDRLALRPRVAIDVSQIDASGTLAGQRLRIPVVLAPLGAIELLTPAGGLASAQAGERFGVPAMISSVTEPSFEEIAGASAGAKIAQLYIRGDAQWSDALIDRVVSAGYVAVAVTVDSAYYGRRERQLRSRWVPASFTREGEPGREWQAHVTWDWLARMRDRSGLPFIVKGIQTAQDAERAAALGIEVIYVSNHGGRQLDHAEAAIETLREVVDAVGARAEIVVDGGFERGTDVLKAVALGASAVGLGRLQAYALAAGGAGALVRMLEILEQEIETAMGLLGVTRLDQLDPSYVKRAGHGGD